MYRVALLLDGTTVAKPTRDLVRWLAEAPDIELVALLVHPPQQAESRTGRLRDALQRRGIYGLLSWLAFSALIRFERACYLRAPQFRAHIAEYDIAAAAPTIVIDPIVSKSGHVYRFSPGDVDRVRALDLDLMIRQGSGILRGGILGAARQGVVSLHHGDNRINRGGPAAFWEAYAGADQTGFIVQRLTEELDGGEVLARGAMTTDPIFSRNQAILYDRSNVYLMDVVRRLRDGAIESEPPQLYPGPLHRLPTLRETAGYGLRSFGRFLRRFRLRVAGRRHHWHVGYLWGAWQNAVLWRAKILPDPPGSYLADPFVLARDGAHTLFVEEYLYEKKKGVISAYDVARDGVTRLGIVLEESCHLSYPYIFEFGGDTYMVPETQGLGQIRLYRAEQFPTEWRLAKIMIDDVAAADATLFDHAGRWWMFATVRRGELGANDAELCLFHADSPLGEWTAHPRNPLFVDPARGRMGGIVRDGDTIYRVAQRQAFGKYGAGFSINRIDVIDPDHYRETQIQQVGPDFAAGLVGIHHLHSAGGLTVFDFARERRPT